MKILEDPATLDTLIVALGVIAALLLALAAVLLIWLWSEEMPRLGLKGKRRWSAWLTNWLGYEK